MIVLQKKITNENNAFDIEKNMLKYIFNDAIERLELSANVALSLLISYKNSNLLILICIITVLLILILKNLSKKTIEIFFIICKDINHFGFIASISW